MSTPNRTLPFDRPDRMSPPPAYAELRASESVAPVTTPDGQRAWLVTSYDAVATVLSDPRFGMAPAGVTHPDNESLFQDGEPHARLRRLVAKAFTPRSVAALRPRVELLAADHVANVADRGPPADLVAAVAAPVPIIVIGELLGVAIEERDRFIRLVDAVSTVDAFGVVEMAPEDADTAGRGWTDLTGYVSGLVSAKRVRPDDDLLSALIAVHDTDDGRLSDNELVTLAATLVAAGYLTTCNAISVGTIQLVTEGRLATLATAPDRADAVVEETLRRQSGLSTEALPRYAHEDVELAGVPIAAGDLVLPRVGAANRDPAWFADPDRFLPDRRTGQHMAFGRGPHHCLGAALARLEVGAVLSALAQRLPGLRLLGSVEDVVWSASPIDPGPVALHVTW